MFRQDDGRGNATWIPAAPPMPVGPSVPSTLDKISTSATATDLSALALGVIGDRATVNDGSTDTRIPEQPSLHRVERREDGSFEVVQVAKRNDGTTIAPNCRARIGGGNATTTSRGAADPSLSRLVVGIQGAGGCALPADSRVWVWVRNQGIVDVSASACTDVVACGPAKVTNFEGGSRDVRRVYFSTAQKLSDGNTAAGADAAITDLYEYDFDRIGPRLVPITPGVNPGGAPATAGAGVNRVARVSPDGSRAYFVANGRALAGPNARGQSPTPGGRNLYVYHRPDGAVTGTIKFVATLASNDSVIWGQDAARKVETGGSDGRYLYFVSRARLTSDEAPADATADIFRYDAQTEQIQRVWRPEPEYNGVSRTAGATFYTQSTVPDSARAETQVSKIISRDGERIFFETAQSLDPADVNQTVDAYLWDGRDSSVTLISGGEGTSDVVTSAMTPDGATSFLFGTSTRLVSQHTSPINALYVLRRGGGFVLPPLPTPPCAGDACQGDQAPSAPLTGGGGSETAQGANVVENGPPPSEPARITVSVASPSRQRGTARLRIRSSVSGRVRVSGRDMVTRTVRARAGASTTMTIRLTKRGRASLKKRGTVRLAGRAVLTPDEGKIVRSSFMLRFAAPAAKRGDR